MSGGTTCWIYGGGEKGNVTGISKLTISNTAAITENILEVVIPVLVEIRK